MPSKVEGLKELEELRVLVGKQEKEWEERKGELMEHWKGELVQEWEEKKREDREVIMGEMSALRQVLEEKQGEKKDTSQVEQLRYEMQQKVESQLFNNDNRVNSMIDTLKQRMEVTPPVYSLLEVRGTEQTREPVLRVHPEPDGVHGTPDQAGEPQLQRTHAESVGDHESLLQPYGA